MAKLSKCQEKGIKEMSNCDEQTPYLPLGECDDCAEYLATLQAYEEEIQRILDDISNLKENLADYKGSFATYSDLTGVTANNNDYAVVLQDETHSNATTRYIYTNNNWVYQYTVSDKPFTQEQMNAINSGITSGLVLQFTNKVDRRTTSGNRVYSHNGATQSDIKVFDTIDNGDDNALLTSGAVKDAILYYMHSLYVFEEITVPQLSNKTIAADSVLSLGPQDINLYKEGCVAFGIISYDLGGTQAAPTKLNIRLVDERRQFLEMSLRNYRNASITTGTVTLRIMYAKDIIPGMNFGN